MFFLFASSKMCNALDLSEIDISLVKNISHMLYSCESLETFN